MILGIPSTFRSAVLIKDTIEKLSGVKLDTKLVYQGTNPVLIRYGNSTGFPKEDTELNSKEFIRICTSKLTFSNLMRSNNIYSPIYYSNPEDIKPPIMIRTSLSSTGGRGIIICPDKETFDKNWKPGYYATPFVKLEWELRVHVLGGSIEKVFKKEKEIGVESEYPIRNIKNGYSYKLKDLHFYTKLNPLVEKLTTLFGKDAFYGMDIGWDKSKKEYFVIEFNSAPNLNAHSAEMYAQYFIKKLNL